MRVLAHGSGTCRPLQQNSKILPAFSWFVYRTAINEGVVERGTGSQSWRNTRRVIRKNPVGSLPVSTVSAQRQKGAKLISTRNESCRVHGIPNSSVVALHKGCIPEQRSNRASAYCNRHELRRTSASRCRRQARKPACGGWTAFRWARAGVATAYRSSQSEPAAFVVEDIRPRLIITLNGQVAIAPSRFSPT
jgi:hypothetical protein